MLVGQLIIQELEERVLILEKHSQTLVASLPGQDFSEKEAFYIQQASELEQRIIFLTSQVDEQRALSQQQHHLSELEQQVIQLQQQQPNWERQITEIIDWVGNEKEARNYLQQMAATMTKELEQLKQQHQYSVQERNHTLQQQVLTQQYLSGKSYQTQQQNANYGTTTWQERRSARVDKQELLQLQLELNNEIEDKQRIQAELARVQRELNVVVADLTDSKQEMARIQDQQSKRLSFPIGNAPNTLFSQKEAPTVASKPLETDLDSDLDSTPDESSASSTNKTGTLSQQKQQHSFIIRTFVAPLKCNHCTSLMVGLIRQGLVCESCGFACHVSCANLGIQQCPCDDSRQRPVGIDPQRGIGTAYEGYVKIPKARGGVRKGWVRMFVVVCDFKLFLYDLNSSSEISSVSGSLHGPGASGDGTASGLNVTPFVSVNTLIDMR